MSARDVTFTLMALGHVAGCRGETATEILAEAVGEIVRLNAELAAKSAAYRDNIATWMTKHGDKTAECHEYRTALETIASGTVDKMPPYTCAPREVLQKIAAKALEGK